MTITRLIVYTSIAIFFTPWAQAAPEPACTAQAKTPIKSIKALPPAVRAYLEPYRAPRRQLPMQVKHLMRAM